jgi:hypothetical protein
MNEESPRYAAYMLRLWQAGSDESSWCASLESPHTGELHVFAQLQALFAFLENTTTDPAVNNPQVNDRHVNKPQRSALP